MHCLLHSNAFAIDHHLFSPQLRISLSHSFFRSQQRIYLVGCCCFHHFLLFLPDLLSCGWCLDKVYTKIRFLCCCFYTQPNSRRRPSQHRPQPPHQGPPINRTNFMQSQFILIIPLRATTVYNILCLNRTCASAEGSTVTQKKN